MTHNLKSIITRFKWTNFLCPVYILVGNNCSGSPFIDIPFLSSSVLCANMFIWSVVQKKLRMKFVLNFYTYFLLMKELYLSKYPILCSTQDYSKFDSFCDVNHSSTPIYFHSIVPRLQDCKLAFLSIFSKFTFFHFRYVSEYAVMSIVNISFSYFFGNVFTIDSSCHNILYSSEVFSLFLSFHSTWLILLLIILEISRSIFCSTSQSSSSMSTRFSFVYQHRFTFLILNFIIVSPLKIVTVLKSFILSYVGFLRRSLSLSCYLVSLYPLLKFHWIELSRSIDIREGKRDRKDPNKKASSSGLFFFTSNFFDPPILNTKSHLR